MISDPKCDSTNQILKKWVHSKSGNFSISIVSSILLPPNHKVLVLVLPEYTDRNRGETSPRCNYRSRVSRAVELRTVDPMQYVPVMPMREYILSPDRAMVGQLEKILIHANAHL